MKNIQDIIDECAVFYRFENYESGAIIRVPFCHWPEKQDFYTIGIFESEGKVYLSDLASIVSYLAEKDVDLKDYKERKEKIMKEFHISAGKGGSFVMDIYKPEDTHFVVLCISNFLQALTFLSRIEL